MPHVYSSSPPRLPPRPPQSPLAALPLYHAAHLRLLRLQKAKKAAAAASHVPPEAPSRMERIQTLSRAYSHMIVRPETAAAVVAAAPCDDGVSGSSSIEKGKGRAAVIKPVPPPEKKERDDVFDLPTRVRNLEGIEAAEPWRCAVCLVFCLW